MTQPARTRLAPSPTGHMHLGTARNALYNYLLAKQTNGQFLIRIEDTDTARTVPGAEQEIYDGLRWLGLQYDEGPDVGGAYGPYRQTERRAIYHTHAELLIQRGHAYPCFCTPQRLEAVRKEQLARKENPHYDGTCRVIAPADAAQRVSQGESHVVRFKMAHEGETVAHDHLRGDIVTQNSQLNDQVLMKSDGLPTYHLAAMVDDHEMRITHVLRGSEWLGTFPLHVNIVRAFGWDEPIWIHLSLFLKPSGKGKMSKRESTQAAKDGYSIYIKDLEDLGFTPQGVLNWCALMGWGVPEDDVLSLDQMIARFSIDHLTASPAAINFQRLDHFNAAHIRLMTDEVLTALTLPFFSRAGLKVQTDVLRRVIPLLRPRLVTLDDCIPFGGFFFQDEVVAERDDLLAEGHDAAEGVRIGRDAVAILQGVAEWTHTSLEPPMREYVMRSGKTINQVFGLLRVATTGQKVSPPLFESMEIIGREKCMARIERVIAVLGS